MRLLFISKIFCICFFTSFVASAVETRMAYSDLIPIDLQEFLYNDSVSLDKELKADITNLSAYQSGSLPMIEDFLSDQIGYLHFSLT